MIIDILSEYTQENVQRVSEILTDFIPLSDTKKNHLQFDFQRVYYLLHDVSKSCYGDKLNHALVNYNGDVFGCTARDFIPENRIGFLELDGTIKYNEEKQNLRNNAKLYKKVCQSCRIAPICGGGCKQRAYESLEIEGCSMGYSEEDIDEMITDIFEFEFGLDIE